MEMVRRHNVPHQGISQKTTYYKEFGSHYRSMLVVCGFNSGLSFGMIVLVAV